MNQRISKIFIGVAIVATFSLGNACENNMRAMNQHLGFASKFYDKNNPSISDMHLKLALQAGEKARRSCGSRNIDEVERVMIKIMKIQNM